MMGAEATGSGVEANASELTATIGSAEMAARKVCLAKVRSEALGAPRSMGDALSGGATEARGLGWVP